MENSMIITKETKVIEILNEYGDIAGVMEAMGIKSIGKYSFRRILTRFISVEKAAKIHKKPLDEFLLTLNRAVEHEK